ncbi:organic solute transporter Ostalpha-domain-containing protein [Lobosporangium transversale]|uniref:Organic solute transporter Ostalpha-domain-containing protein n=1 Tax=Lobosporangium transversale TaxID=64571 RepID=A0A1Y2H0P9_9FUNG|nr:organic solute transporter Ostalpha-domain-containing protein [Lobosporangium transversale]ORZ26642.1 organic solute transporter Ostalpha-domain-containing protein [Lobosporangium transversale]|eukprot:XP_021884405.1 organic solute transporter Ostalpha-domain-containing protein [Lobosporangium transversale]
MDQPNVIIGDDGTGPGSGSGSGSELSSTAVWAAGIFAFSATLISLASIWMQLKNYRKPLLQRFVVRILWMVPIFAISSWISLVSLDIAFYVDAFRDIYEAFVIYCFFSLLVYYLGGERSLLLMLHGRPYTKHLWPVSLWSRDVDVGDPYTFLFIKRGILQYVYVKPVLAAVTMLLKSNGAYNDGSISLKSGYFWVSFVYNLSVCLSLYCLGMFFVATQDDLEEFRPIPKFLCIKAVIFFSFWQGFAISVLIATGIMRNTTADTAVAIQDFLICFEMVFAAIGHWYSFSHKDYTELDIHSARMPIYYAVRDASGIKDIIQDSLETLKGTRFTYRTFEPSEGVATSGMSRDGRIMAGLRYTGGGTSKYWLPDPDKLSRDAMRQATATAAGEYNDEASSSSLPFPGGRPDYGRNPNSYTQQVLGSSYSERAPSLYFPDLDDQDEDGMEELYDASKQLKFGDYNFPAIDVYDPHRSKESDRRKMARKNKKKARQHSYESGYGGAYGGNDVRYGETSSLLAGADSSLREGGHETIGRPLMSEPEYVGSTFGKTGWSTVSGDEDRSTKIKGDKGEGGATARATTTTATREGCVDNVNGYVPEKKKRGVMPTNNNLSSSIGSSSRNNNNNNSNSNNNNYLHFGNGYDTYGYGYQSYQNQPQQQQQQQQHQYRPNGGDDEEEHRGPMFFFL